MKSRAEASAVLNGRELVLVKISGLKADIGGESIAADQCQSIARTFSFELVKS
ncbi:MAG: hypothetical protein ACLSFZ_08110 [Frisingicoccus sp.]